MMLRLLLLFVLSVGIEICSAGSAGWSYDEHHGNGPSAWNKEYPNCAGTKQSPIDIRPAQASQEQFEQFNFNGYQTDAGLVYQLVNNGHTVQLTIKSGNITIRGTGLAGPYKLAQFHLHWGATDDVGSEHTVDGKYYPLEIHFVHYNTKYADIATALPNKDGLAVLGIFAQVGNKRNEALQQIINRFNDVTNAGNPVNVTAFALDELLPVQASRQDFVRYDGSLTTPTCDESVTWTVFREPITISQTQLNQFRTLNHNADGLHHDPLVNNYRPVQPVNSRKVRRSYDVAPALAYRDVSNLTLLFGSALVALITFNTHL